MPLTLELVDAPRLLHLHARVSVPERLRRLTNRVIARLRRLWGQLLREAVTTFPRQQVTEAVQEDDRLAVLALLFAHWHAAVETPARRLLPVLATEALTTAGETSLPTIEGTLATPARFQPELPEIDQWVATYVGQQVQTITETTQDTIREAVRQLPAGRAVAAVLGLQALLGLTPRQAHGLQRLHETLTRQGASQSQITRTLRLTAGRSRQQRADRIAETMGHTVVQQGAHEAWTQAIRRGDVQPEQVRRQWVTQPGCCPAICGPIPGMNEGGVGHDEPFQTPGGLLLTPPGHPTCRCTISTAVQPLGAGG